MSQITVYKCGGDIASSADNIRKVLGIIRADREQGNQAVLVHSGMRRVTDDLLTQLYYTPKTDGEFMAEWYKRHKELANALGFEKLDSSTEQIFEETGRLLRQIRAPDQRLLGLENRILELRSMTGEIDPLPHEIAEYLTIKNSILVSGERFILHIIKEFYSRNGIAAVGYTGELLGVQTSSLFDQTPNFNPKISETLLHHLDAGELPIVTGYDAGSPSGVVTLGRSGSDKTATLLGLCLKADVCLLKNTEGVMSADPKRVPQARFLPEIAYVEAAEAGNIQLEAVQYVEAAGISFSVRSLDGKITNVVRDSSDKGIKIVKGYLNITLLYVREVRDQPGAEEYILDVFRKRGVNKLLGMDSINSVAYILEGNQDQLRDVKHDLNLRWESERRKRFGPSGINGAYVEERPASLVLVIGQNMSLGKWNDFGGAVKDYNPILIGGWREGIVSTYAVLPRLEENEFNNVLRDVHKKIVVK